MAETSAIEIEEESLSSETFVEDEEFTEKSYNGLFTKSQAVDMFLFIQFMPTWLTIVAVSIFIMFAYSTYEMGNIIYSILWLLILVFSSFIVAFFCCGFYIIIHTLSVCIPTLQPLSEIFLSGVRLPHYCATKMTAGAPLY